MPRPVVPDFQEQNWHLELVPALYDISDRADGQSAIFVVTATSMTVLATHAGGVIHRDVAVANTTTFPAGVFVAGQVIEVCQVGVGLSSLVQGTGMLLHCRGKTTPLALAGQWAEARIRYIGPGEAVVGGDIG